MAWLRGYDSHYWFPRAWDFAKYTLRQRCTMQGWYEWRLFKSEGRLDDASVDAHVRRVLYYARFRYRMRHLAKCSKQWYQYFKLLVIKRWKALTARITKLLLPPTSDGGGLQ